MNKFIKNFFVILICGALNYFLCWIIQRVFVLPIYFDTVMVMFVLFAFGLCPAIGTLIVHYIIAVTRDYLLYKTAPYLALYLLSGFAIILITWLFMRKKENLQNGVNYTFLYILSASIMAALASSLIGGAVNFFIIRFITLNDNWQGILLSLGKIRLNLFFSLFIGRIPIAFLDRVISTFIGYGIFLLYNKIPQREK